MASEAEARVLRLLGAIEFSPDDVQAIRASGTEGVTVVCEAALGTYVGLVPDVRPRAVAVLGWLDHPQARETLELLVGDAAPAIAIRAMRAVGRQRHDGAVERLDQLLARPETPALLAAEAVAALRAIDSPAARARVAGYASLSPATHPHRGSRVVHDVLAREAGRRRGGYPAS